MISNIEQRYGFCQQQYYQKQKFIKKVFRFFSLHNYYKCIQLLENIICQNNKNVVKIFVTEKDLKNQTVCIIEELNLIKPVFKGTNIQSVIEIFLECLKGLIQLKNMNILHGDIQSQYIGRRNKNEFFLFLRSNQFEVSIEQNILNQIKNFQKLMFSPKIFDSIIQKQPFQFNEKDDLFQLGFLFLQVYENIDNFQQFYDFSEKKFQHKIFQEYLHKICYKIDHQLSKSFLFFLTTKILCKEKNRLTIQDTIIQLNNLLSQFNKQETDNNIRKHRRIYSCNLQETPDVQDAIDQQKNSLAKLQLKQNNTPNHLNWIRSIQKNTTAKKCAKQHNLNLNYYKQKPRNNSRKKANQIIQNFQNQNSQISSPQKIFLQNKQQFFSLSKQAPIKIQSQLKHKILTPKQFLEKMGLNHKKEKRKLKVLKMFQKNYKIFQEKKTIKKFYKLEEQKNISNQFFYQNQNKQNKQKINLLKRNQKKPALRNYSFQIYLFLFFFKLEGFGSSKTDESFLFAFRAFEFQSNFLGNFSLFFKNWFGLSTEPFLLNIVSSSSLYKETLLTFFVLRYFVFSMCFTIPGTVSSF